MVIIMFRSRLRPENADAFERDSRELQTIARSMPGFISYKPFRADDGERLSVIEWRSTEELVAWREHPRHKKIQERGRSHYYAEYTLMVCDSPRMSGFSHDPDSVGSDA